VTPATAMMSVFASESQKNPQSSLVPSAGPTSGGGVEPPGVGVYGVRKEEPSSDMPVRVLETGPFLWDSLVPPLRGEPGEPRGGAGRFQHDRVDVRPTLPGHPAVPLGQLVEHEEGVLVVLDAERAMDVDAEPPAQ